MKKRKTLSTYLLSLFSLMLITCTPGLRAQLEYADYLLDRAQFEDAVTLLNVLDSQSPGNTEVKGKLASAHLAHAVVGGDKTYLSLVADYFDHSDPSQSGQSDFQQFSAKSPPMTTEQILELAEARRMLDTEIPDSQKSKGNYLQLGFARLLEINAIGVIKAGVLSDDNFCNSDHSKGPEGVPDSYNPNALTPEDTALFNEDVSKVGSDFENAGLSSDNAVIRTVTRIGENLSTFSTLQDYLNSQYGFDSVPCP